MALQEAKDKVAKEAKWDDFNDLLSCHKDNLEVLNKFIDKAILLYHTRKLEEAGKELVDYTQYVVWRDQLKAKNIIPTPMDIMIWMRKEASTLLASKQAEIERVTELMYKDCNHHSLQYQKLERELSEYKRVKEVEFIELKSQLVTKDKEIGEYKKTVSHLMNVGNSIEEELQEAKSANTSQKEKETGRSNRYSVSLVYQKQGVGIQENAIRVLITDAENEEQALGLGIKEFEKEMVNFLLSMKVVIPIYQSSPYQEKQGNVDSIKDSIAKEKGFHILSNTGGWTRWDKMYDESTPDERIKLLKEVISRISQLSQVREGEKGYDWGICLRDGCNVKCQPQYRLCPKHLREAHERGFDDSNK